MQVVGTNGKGTTTVAAAKAFEVSGVSCGAYLSPHVFSYTERVMVGGKPISEDSFAAGMSEVIEVADKHELPASQFELLTAGALMMFQEMGCQRAVLEAGLGARYDATTAADPEIVVLTNVSLDHTEYLGETVQEIAREKLASLRYGMGLVLGTADPIVKAVAHEECARVGAELLEIVDVNSPSELKPYARDLAPYQQRNMKLGVRAAELVLNRRLKSAGMARVAEAVRLPARFEVHLAGNIPVVIDGGHNPAGIQAAVEAVRSRFGDRPLTVVFGVLRDKDIKSMLNKLQTEADALILTRPENERAADPEWVVRRFSPLDKGGRTAKVVDNIEDAVSDALMRARRSGGMVLVTGSLYTGAQASRRSYER